MTVPRADALHPELYDANRVAPPLGRNAAEAKFPPRQGGCAMKTPILSTILAAAAMAAHAAPDHRPAVQALLDQGLKVELSAPELVAAIVAQNAAHEGLTAAEIEALDQQWRAEVAAGGGALVERLLAGEASERLRAIQSAHGGLLTEVFIVDRHGLNVAQTDPTSDYWQGDEDKFTRTFSAGPDAVFIDEVEFDESTQTLQAQVSFTLVDPATGEPVGAATAALDVEMLAP